MFIVVMVMVLAISGIVGVAYYTDQEVIVNPVNQALTLTPEIQCNVAGGCMKFNIPLEALNVNELLNYSIHKFITVGVGWCGVVWCGFPIPHGKTN